MGSHISRRTGVFALMGAAVLFGANHIAARFAFDHGASVTTAVLARSSFTALAVLTLIRVQSVPLSVSARLLGRTGIVGVALAAQSYCIYSAVARIPAALALLAFHTFPVTLALLNWVTGRGRPNGRVATAMPVAVAGLWLALYIGRTAIDVGVVWALASGAIFAVVLLLTDLWLTPVDGRVRTALSLGTVALLAAAVGSATGALHAPSDAIGWLGLGLLSAFYALAITCLFVVLPKMGSANYAMVLNLEPISLLLLGWLLLGQAMNVTQIAGAAIVVAAVTWLSFSSRPGRSNPPAEAIAD